MGTPQGLSGNTDDVIANDNVTAGSPAIVTIAKTDVAFKTERCGTWQKGSHGVIFAVDRPRF